MPPSHGIDEWKNFVENRSTIHWRCISIFNWISICFAATKNAGQNTLKRFRRHFYETNTNEPAKSEWWCRLCFSNRYNWARHFDKWPTVTGKMWMAENNSNLCAPVSLASTFCLLENVNRIRTRTYWRWCDASKLNPLCEIRCASHLPFHGRFGGDIRASLMKKGLAVISDLCVCVCALYEYCFDVCSPTPPDETWIRGWGD